MAPPEQRLPTLREYIDQFYWARGFTVLEKLRQAATEAKNQHVEQVLGSMEATIQQFFKGQFGVYSKDQQLPQPAMLREMLRLFNTYDANAVIGFVDQNIQLLDGHFFLSISESLRNVRGRMMTAPDPALELTMKALMALGRMVAEKRVALGLPCSFRVLYGV